MDPIDGLAKRRLILDDVKETVVLSEEAGWNQTERDWRFMIEHGHGFGLKSPDQRLVATALTLPHGGKIAWISMVLVTQKYRNQGLATHLLNSCIDHLQKSLIIPLLDATPAGKLVYEKIGFRSLYDIHRLIRDPNPVIKEGQKSDGSIHLKQPGKTEFQSIIQFDKGITGADRSAILTHLQQRQPGLSILAQDKRGRLLGYAFAREGSHAYHIGPVVAKNTEVAISLIEYNLRRISGPVYIDTLAAHKPLLNWLKKIKFKVQRPFTRMILGPVAELDQPELIFAAAGPELG